MSAHPTGLPDHTDRLTVSGKMCETEDRYAASIDFSNACREFYMSRVKATESFKEQMNLPDTKTCHVNQNVRQMKPRNSIDSAMDTLRKEMASLMDQDLSLMKQLLTLNETIEEIKFKRLHGNKNHLQVSSRELEDSGSDWSVSDTDMYETEDMVEQLSKDVLNDNVNYDYRSSNKSCQRTDNNCSNSGNISDLHVPSILINGQDYEYRTHNKPEVNLGGKPLRIVHGCQNSIDSGYDESDSYQTDIEYTL